jgi:hypothetical protein
MGVKSKRFLAADFILRCLYDILYTVFFVIIWWSISRWQMFTPACEFRYTCEAKRMIYEKVRDAPIVRLVACGRKGRGHTPPQLSDDKMSQILNMS